MTAIPPSSRKRCSRIVDEESRQKRHDEILATAARVFAQAGYQNTDMQAIADAGGVAKGTIYLYFKSKEALFLAAVDKGIRDMQAFIDAHTEGISDPLDRIAESIRAYLTFFQAHPEQVELLIQERAEFRDRKKSTYFEHREKRREVWHTRVRGLIEAGRFRAVPVSRIDDVMCDLVYGTMFTNHFAGRHKPVEEQVADILDVTFNGLLTEDERQKRREKGDKAC